MKSRRTLNERRYEIPHLRTSSKSPSRGADPNFLRDGVQLLAQELINVEVTDLVGAEPHQRTAWRTTYRNGYRDREWDTRVL